ncbi:DAK2 domain-containing protein, partial [Phytoactinopolyspora endophytica]|uniref:DAK2 domain-containing protein n=1 Tax=Phytoactinopolyspora endophytica TaxID=1642495 RepID=UPI00101D948E
WSEGAGGTSGALWGGGLTAVGGALSDHDGATDTEIVAAMRAGTDAVLRLGQAEVGDKTIVDALVPFTDAFADAVGAGAPLREA